MSELKNLCKCYPKGEASDMCGFPDCMGDKEEIAKQLIIAHEKIEQLQAENEALKQSRKQVIEDAIFEVCTHYGCVNYKEKKGWEYFKKCLQNHANQLGGNQGG